MASDEEHGISEYGQPWRCYHQGPRGCPWSLLPTEAMLMPACVACDAMGHDGVFGLYCRQEPWATRIHQVFADRKIYYIHKFGGMESRGRMTGFE